MTARSTVNVPAVCREQDRIAAVLKRQAAMRRKR